MPAATNLTISSPKAAEGAPAAAPGAAELFAALVAGVTPGGGEIAGETPEETGETESDAPAAGAEAGIADAALLLPLIEQQRAAQPRSAAPPQLGVVTAEPSTATAGRNPVAQRAHRAEKAAPSLARDPLAETVQPHVKAPVSGLKAEPALKTVGEEGAAGTGSLTSPPTSPSVNRKCTGGQTDVALSGEMPVQQAAQTARAAPAAMTGDPARRSTITPELGRAAPDTAAPAPAPQAVLPGTQAAQPKQVAAPQAVGTPAGVAIAAVLPSVGQVLPQAVAAVEQERATGKPTRSEPVSGKAVVEGLAAGLAAADPARTSAPAPVVAPARGAENADLKVPTDTPVGDKATPVTERPAAAPLQMPAPVVTAPTAAAQPPAAPGAAMAQPMLDMGGDSAWIDTLARDISKIASADGTMRFRLAPETLGELRVEITQSERGALVRMQVSSEAAQQALADAQPRLAAEARAQGARIAETEISFTGGQAEQRDAGRQAPSQQQAQAEQPQRASRGGGGGAARASAHDQAEPAGRRNDRYA